MYIGVHMARTTDIDRAPDLCLLSMPNKISTALYSDFVHRRKCIKYPKPPNGARHLTLLLLPLLGHSRYVLAHPLST